LASLDWLFRDGLAGNLKDETTVLYVSPLKALSNDIDKNLEKPLAGICAALRASDGRNVEVRAEVRPQSRSICFLLRCGAAVF
jgi:ATP-dependent Lhr-like helicase